jgi:ribosomal protein S18 acetylase RimI-like enzyme
VESHGDRPARRGIKPGSYRPGAATRSTPRTAPHWRSPRRRTAPRRHAARSTASGTPAGHFVPATDGSPLEGRPATPDDAPAVRRIARIAWHAAYDDLLGPDRVEALVDEWHDAERLRGTFADPDSAHAAIDEATGGAEAELVRLYALPDYWGSGVGSALLDAIAEDLRAADVGRLRAVVAADNDVGRRFYDRHGFRCREERAAELAGASLREVVVVADVGTLGVGRD